jgi:hypothetical protein
MTRVIKASALTREHIGVIASHEGAVKPQRLADVQPPYPVTHRVLTWADGTGTSVPLDAGITIHEPKESQ